MTTRTLRRASLTALVFAALSSAAAAETTPPAPPGDRGPRMERPHHERGDRPMHMRMRWSQGGMMHMLGVVPMRPGQAIEYSEGRIAFLKAELKITDAQSKAWDAFAAALRENVAKLTEAYKAPDREAMDKMSPGERLGWFEKAVAARLDAVKRARAAIEPLYAALGDDQKKTFDRFIPTGGMRADFRDRMRDRMRERMERRGQQPGQPGQPGQPAQPRQQ
jgi:hypothetical protein